MSTAVTGPATNILDLGGGSESGEGVVPPRAKPGRKGKNPAGLGKAPDPREPSGDAGFDAALAMILGGGLPQQGKTVPAAKPEGASQPPPEKDSPSSTGLSSPPGHGRLGHAIAGPAEQPSRELTLANTGATAGASNIFAAQLAAAGGRPPTADTPPTAHVSTTLPAEALKDESLRGAVLTRSAHLHLDSASGPVGLHINVHDGVADVRVDGSGAAAFAGREGELRLALAAQGIELGRLESGEGITPSVKAGISAPAEVAATRVDTLPLDSRSYDPVMASVQQAVASVMATEAPKKDELRSRISPEGPALSDIGAAQAATAGQQEAVVAAQRIAEIAAFAANRPRPEELPQTPQGNAGEQRHTGAENSGGRSNEQGEQRAPHSPYELRGPSTGPGRAGDDRSNITSSGGGVHVRA